jgi:hypothetical protein
MEAAWERAAMEATTRTKEALENIMIASGKPSPSKSGKLQVIALFS